MAVRVQVPLRVHSMKGVSKRHKDTEILLYGFTNNFLCVFVSYIIIIHPLLFFSKKQKPRNGNLRNGASLS